MKAMEKLMRVIYPLLLALVGLIEEVLEGGSEVPEGVHEKLIALRAAARELFALKEPTETAAKTAPAHIHAQYERTLDSLAKRDERFLSRLSAAPVEKGPMPDGADLSRTE